MWLHFIINSTKELQNWQHQDLHQSSGFQEQVRPSPIIHIAYSPISSKFINSPAIFVFSFPHTLTTMHLHIMFTGHPRSRGYGIGVGLCADHWVRTDQWATKSLKQGRQIRMEETETHNFSVCPTALVLKQGMDVEHKENSYRKLKHKHSNSN